MGRSKILKHKTSLRFCKIANKNYRWMVIEYIDGSTIIIPKGCIGYDFFGTKNYIFSKKES